MQLNRERLIDVAVAELGVPYEFGAEVNAADKAPKKLDCSEFVEWCYAQVGVPVPDGSQNQFEASDSTALPMPGDVGFFRKSGAASTHHVGMIYDRNLVIESRGDPYNAVILRPRSKWEAFSEFSGWRRFRGLA